MKLKYYLVFTAFALSSCGEGFFEQYPSNDITEGNFYKTDDDFNQGVVSCYAKLKTMMSFHLTEIGYRSDENILESMAVSTQDRYHIDNFIETASNGILSDIWDAWYNGIYRCNDVLDHMNGVQIPNYNKYRGECLFMRSWWYFNLYRTFGVVPIARTVVPPAAAKLIPRCTEEEMYSLLTEDLAEAARLLPDTRNAEKARVTGIAAYTLLAKVYLTFGKHAEARTALDEAMKATGYGLESTTKRVFDINNKMNKEVIFALYYNKTNDNGHGYWYSANTDVMADIRNPTPEFKAIYDESDNRLALIDTYTKIQSNLFAMTKWYDTYDATYTTRQRLPAPALCRHHADVRRGARRNGPADGADMAQQNPHPCRTRRTDLGRREDQSRVYTRTGRRARTRIRPGRPPLVRPGAAGAGRGAFPQPGLHARRPQPDLPHPAEPDRDREQPLDPVAKPRFLIHQPLKSKQA